MTFLHCTSKWVWKHWGPFYSTLVATHYIYIYIYTENHILKCQVPHFCGSSCGLFSLALVATLEWGRSLLSLTFFSTVQIKVCSFWIKVNISGFPLFCQLFTIDLLFLFLPPNSFWAANLMMLFQTHRKMQESTVCLTYHLKSLFFHIIVTSCPTFALVHSPLLHGGLWLLCLIIDVFMVVFCACSLWAGVSNMIQWRYLTDIKPLNLIIEDNLLESNEMKYWINMT
jgi:hypothetical protein